MTKWLMRGLAFAALMVAVRLVQSVLINTFPAQASLIVPGVLLLGAPWAVLWGLFDGRADAKAHPDPDRRDDLAMIWLVAGLIAGLLSGAVCWFIALFYKGLYAGGLLEELSTFAGFTALIVFVPAAAGVAIGRRLLDRQYAKTPVRHHGLAAEGEERADVFAAVGVGGEAAGAASAEATAPAPAVPSTETTAEIPVPTEEIETADQTTAEIPTGQEKPGESGG